MKKKAHLKLSTVVILLFLSCFLLVKCNISDNDRDPISIKRLDLKYVKENDPDFFIDSFRVELDDKNIGKQVDLNYTDYHWVFDLLIEEKNKKEIFEDKKENTYKVKLIFAEYGWTFEHDTSKYDGKQTTFYISKNLRNQFISKYLTSHPIHTVIEKSGEVIKGIVTIMEYGPVEQGVSLEIAGDGHTTPIKIADLFEKNTAPFSSRKYIPFTIMLSELSTKLNNSTKAHLITTSADGTILFDFDKIPLSSE